MTSFSSSVRSQEPCGDLWVGFLNKINDFGLKLPVAPGKWRQTSSAFQWRIVPFEFAAEAEGHRVLGQMPRRDIPAAK
jgi:hypothetical protein